MKSFIKFFILFFIVFDFTSCLDDNNSDPHYFFYDEPAIVELLSDSSIVQTAYGKFCVSSLKNEDLQTNDILWSSFTVEKKDENKVQMPDNQFYYKANNFRYDKIDSAKVIIPANTQEFESYLTDDYKVEIDRAVLYKTYVDSLLFFGFEHGSSAANFEYELVLNPTIESSNGHPTLYIRAKASSRTHDKHIFAFEMTDFVDYYKRTFPRKDTIQFNLKYYVETKNDKDVYREFLSNPLSWHLK
ncbi:MAG: hypothetical protein LBR97_03225 [Dysgonamonadaceae bacterium]|jgi:hypothetical protein|nr:hypothetical protein [Dysgonamonadaceae bacterium]